MGDQAIEPMEATSTDSISLTMHLASEVFLKEELLKYTGLNFR